LTITIRNMQPADIHAMHALHQQVVQTTCASAYSVEDITAWLQSQAPESFLHGHATGDHFLVAEEGDELVGFCGWRGHTIIDLYIHPAHQRKGIARQLVTAAEAEAGKPFTLVESTLNGVEFYKKLGFKAVLQHHRVGMPKGVLIQEVRMQRFPAHP
jgi:GNAT superfamily N-acetyltransferase